MTVFLNANSFLLKGEVWHPPWTSKGTGTVLSKVKASGWEGNVHKDFRGKKSRPGAGRGVKKARMAHIFQGLCQGPLH